MTGWAGPGPGQANTRNIPPSGRGPMYTMYTVQLGFWAILLSGCYRMGCLSDSHTRAASGSTVSCVRPVWPMVWKIPDANPGEPSSI